MRDDGSVVSGVALVGRLLLASLFILDSVSILRGYAAAGAYLERYGVPALLLAPALALQLGGGILIAVGFLARPAAAALALFCVATALIFHNNLANPGEVLHLEKDLAIAGGLAVLAAFGPGRYVIKPPARS